VRPDGGLAVPDPTSDQFVLDIVRAFNVLAHPDDHVAGGTVPVHVFGKEFPVVIDVVNVRATEQGGTVVDGKGPPVVCVYVCMCDDKVCVRKPFGPKKIHTSTIRQ
jgi:hypothetical protein